jgi:hypothetical protein
MDSIAASFVRCVKCHRDFRSPVSFGTLSDFERAASIGLIAQCPSCYTIFECNGSNMYCELAPSSRDGIPASEPEPPASG